MYERRSYQITTIILTISLNSRGRCWWVALSSEKFSINISFLFTFRLRRHEKFLLNKFIFNWWFYFFLNTLTQDGDVIELSEWNLIPSSSLIFLCFAMLFDGVVDLWRIHQVHIMVFCLCLLFIIECKMCVGASIEIKKKWMSQLTTWEGRSLIF